MKFQTTISDKPISMCSHILITRPGPAGEGLTRKLAEKVGKEHVVHSPIMKIEPITIQPDMNGVKQLIFTSRNGVESFARVNPRRDLPCLTVGKTTNKVARKMGFQSRMAGQDVADLIRNLREHPPQGMCLHLRGEHTSANLVAELEISGIKIRDHITYKQNPLPLTPEARNILERESRVILPLYSSRSVQLFFQNQPIAAPLWVVAISAKVAEQVPDVERLEIATQPDAPSMGKYILDLWETLCHFECLRGVPYSSKDYNTHHAARIRKGLVVTDKPGTSEKTDAVKVATKSVSSAKKTQAKNTTGNSPGAASEDSKKTATTAASDKKTTSKAANDATKSAKPKPTDDKPADKTNDTTDAATTSKGTVKTTSKSPVSPASTQQASQDKRKGGFWPLILGGLIAGGIGYGAATYQYMQTATKEPTVDITPLQASQEKMEQDLQNMTANLQNTTTSLETVNASLAELTKRLDDLETRPAANVTLPEDAVTIARQVIEAELKDLKSQVTALAMTAQNHKAAAEETERATAIRAALSDITVALENGTEFQSGVTILTENGVEIAPVLVTSASDGVPTLANLQAAFPPAARAALQAARTSGDSKGSGFGSFLKTQLGARSLEPQEGNSTDAILSRAEAAIRTGNIQDTLSELDNLSDPASEQFIRWKQSAQTRLDVIDAVQVIREKYN